MTYFYAGKFGFINFPTISIYFFRPRPTLHTVYPYHMACDVNLVISNPLFSVMGLRPQKEFKGLRVRSYVCMYAGFKIGKKFNFINIYRTLKRKFYVLKTQACRNLKSILFAYFLCITCPYTEIIVCSLLSYYDKKDTFEFSLCVGKILEHVSFYHGLTKKDS